MGELKEPTICDRHGFVSHLRKCPYCELEMRDGFFVVNGFPTPGERVLVIRKSGQKSYARLGLKPDSIFRPSGNLHWLTDDGKFADIASDPIVSWERYQ